MEQQQQGSTMQQQQVALFDGFYKRLLERTFSTSVAAIEFCRELCAEFGFTVKQESSSHRNIYVYCSREGLPDSLRNPKRHPKRKRPSKRCDCRWRVILNETKDSHVWRFRKSQSPESCFHNHELLRPEEIEKGWPRQVLDYICELARERLSTPEIRAQVQTRFSDINWNERRFYNRLSEERQRIRQRETVARAHHLTELWTKVCMAAAGSEELTNYAFAQGQQLLRSLCEMARVDTDSFSSAPEFESTGEDEESDDVGPETPQTIVRHSWQDGQPVPKGYTTVVVPEHRYIVRVHNQRSLNEIQSHRALRRSFSTMAQDEPDNEGRRKFVQLDNNIFPLPTQPPPPQQQQLMYTPNSHVNFETSVPIPPYMALPQTQVSRQPAAYSSGYCPSSSEYCASSPENGLQFPPLDASSATVTSTSSPSQPKAIKRRASHSMTPYFMAPPHQQPIFPDSDKVALPACTAPAATRHLSLAMDQQQPIPAYAANSNSASEGGNAYW